MQGKTIAVLTGKVQPYGPNGEPSAFRKAASDKPLQTGPLGFIDDEQADRKHHGGVDKAILQYAYEHYPNWRQTHAHLQSDLTGPGAFGENVSSEGMTETSVCIGDRFRLGRALVEVSQARQPSRPATPFSCRTGRTRNGPLPGCLNCCWVAPRISPH